MFQACKFLVYLLICTPVFALNSYTDQDEYSASLSQPFSSKYIVENCFDGSTSSFCATSKNGSLTITFNQPSKVTNLSLILASPNYIYEYIQVDGTRYEYNSSGTYNFQKATDISIFPSLDSYVFLSEVSFDFEFVGFGGNSEFNCRGFSCWFLTEADYENVWLALLTFIVSIFSLAYLGRIIRTGGQS